MCNKCDCEATQLRDEVKRLNTALEYHGICELCINASVKKADGLLVKNANLRAAVRGKTFYHSDEAVNAEIGRLRVENEELKDQITALTECLNGGSKAVYTAEIYDKTVEDYEEVLADHNRLVRELDILINGEEVAAKQASLCDIVVQLRTKSIKLTSVAITECPNCNNHEDCKSVHKNVWIKCKRFESNVTLLIPSTRNYNGPT